jgi:hypothetical protein
MATTLSMRVPESFQLPASSFLSADGITGCGRRIHEGNSG